MNEQSLRLDLGIGELPKHPASFSAEVVPVLATALPGEEFPLVLDPFAGVGGIQELVNETVGVQMLTDLGLVALDRTNVPTKRLRYGANAAARVESEHVVIFEKPTFVTIP